jgi:damage-control phosphatase, subfamily I
MKTTIDCIPCFLRQALEAARMASPDPSIHETVIRDVLRWSSELDFRRPPAALGQRIHRRLRELTGSTDPYFTAKKELNRLAERILADVMPAPGSEADTFDRAVRLAMAGNVLDMGAYGSILEDVVRASVRRALDDPIVGSTEALHRAASSASSILYLADNAGEVVFDRALIRHLSPARVTVVVRGGPVINDATLDDARDAGLTGLAEVVDNGSDAPGTLLDDVSPDFHRRYAEADLVIAKGQGNFETLDDESRSIFFLFKAKCPVIARMAGVPQGAHVVLHSSERS